MIQNTEIQLAALKKLCLNLDYELFQDDIGSYPSDKS